MPSPPKPTNLLLSILGFFPVLLLPYQLVKSCTLVFFNHRLVVGFICLLLFPVFIFTTFVSSLLAIAINHMVLRHSPSTSSPAPAATPVSPPRPENNVMDDSANREDLDYWLQRCSICFDAQLDLCLEYCRDQYCLNCFRRYVTEVVTSSWGLSVTKIRCPVCQDYIPQSEWSKFVPASVVEQYNKYNQPYRSFSRCCPRCETEVTPCHYRNRLHSRPRSIVDKIKELATSCHDPCCDHYTHHTLQRLLQSLERQDWSSANLPDLHHTTMTAVMAFEDHIGSHRFADTISRYILLLDMKPDTWRKLQFSHIAFFPNVECPTCDCAFCLQCGRDEHLNQTCEQSMQHVIDTQAAPSEVIETVRWTLLNTRRCPSCSILINRDEGCNKVDCSLCGFCFCWVCRSSWSERCGFYMCSEANAEGSAERVPELLVARAELGVPNVSSIEALFQAG